MSTDLSRMYQLVSRIPNGLGELKNRLESHIWTQGLTALEKCGEAALNVGTRSGQCDRYSSNTHGQGTVTGTPSIRTVRAV